MHLLSNALLVALLSLTTFSTAHPNLSSEGLASSGHLASRDILPRAIEILQTRASQESDLYRRSLYLRAIELAPSRLHARDAEPQVWFLRAGAKAGKALDKAGSKAAKENGKNAASSSGEDFRHTSGRSVGPKLEG